MQYFHYDTSNDSGYQKANAKRDFPNIVGFTNTFPNAILNKEQTWCLKMKSIVKPGLVGNGLRISTLYLLNMHTYGWVCEESNVVNALYSQNITICSSYISCLLKIKGNIQRN